MVVKNAGFDVPPSTVVSLCVVLNVSTFLSGDG
jgi:hypothetical protein